MSFILSSVAGLARARQRCCSRSKPASAFTADCGGLTVRLGPATPQHLRRCSTATATCRFVAQLKAQNSACAATTSRTTTVFAYCPRRDETISPPCSSTEQLPVVCVCLRPARTLLAHFRTVGTGGGMGGKIQGGTLRILACEALRTLACELRGLRSRFSPWPHAQPPAATLAAPLV